MDMGSRRELGGFGDLLQDAEQLTAEMETGTDLPRIERSLNQILEVGQRLLSKTTPISQDTSDVKASILLGSKGYDVPKISEKLEGLSASVSFEPLDPVRDTDIEGFLKNERENALLAVIEQTRRNTFEEAERHHCESMENEWEREKQKILNALLGSGQDVLDLQQEPESFLGDPDTWGGRSNLDNVEMAYARQVYIYNEKIRQGSLRPNMVDAFEDMSQKLDDKNIIDLWEMVKCMVDIQITSTSSSSAVRQDQKVQRAFVRQAKKYLERNYDKYIKNTIYGNLHQAQLGGIPGTFNTVKSFLNVRPPVVSSGLEDGLIENHSVWAFIYYCLRCGDMQAAMQVVRKAQHQLGDFPAFLHDFITNPDNRLSPANETKIRLQYRRMVKNSTDPYKRAVYCVVGQCDYDEAHAELTDKIDDYLWLKLSQIQFDTADSSQELYTLEKLQTLLYEEFGENHFNGYQQPFLYFQVLVLTAQFEAAIEFLSRIEKLRCHAVHVALVFYELNLLQLPSTTQAQLLSKDTDEATPVRNLNFARLVMLYTRKFEATDARDALQYFYFLRDLKTPQGENLFMSCVSELVLETREFEMLLGKLERDGTRRPGTIDKFNADTHKIIDLVARDTERKGLFEDAVRLYDLAGNYDKVLELLNKLLSQVVAQVNTPQSNRDRLKNLALSIAERYRSLGHEGSDSNNTTFYLILDLLTFFDTYHSGSVDQSLEIMKQLKLLPLGPEHVEQKVNSFRHYSDEVRRCLPDILLATMNILHTQYKKSKSSSISSPLSSYGGGKSGDGGMEMHSYLRNQARALIMFAGMLPYRLPGDTNARLVQIEVLMS